MGAGLCCKPHARLFVGLAWSLGYPRFVVKLSAQAKWLARLDEAVRDGSFVKLTLGGPRARGDTPAPERTVVWGRRSR